MRPEPGADRGAQSKERLPQSCAAVQARLFDYLDGALAAAEREPIRAHLEACAACRREAALCQQSERALASALSAVPPPGDLRADFYARLAASEQRAAAHRPWLSWKIAVPALAACALAALLIRPALRPPMPPSGDTLSVPSPGTPPAPMQMASGAPVGQVNEPDGGGSALPAPSLRSARTVHSSLRSGRKRARALKPRPMRPLRPTGPIVVASAASPTGNLAKEMALGLSMEREGEAVNKDASILSLAKADHAEADGALPGGMAEKPSLLTAGSAARVAKPGNTDVPAHEEVVLKVVDEERGFTACTRLHSQMSDQDGVETVTVETSSVPTAARLPER